MLVQKELVAWWVKHHSLRLHVLFNRKNNNNKIEIMREKNIITFNQKYDVLLISLFHPPPASEPPDWSSYIEKEWEWPEILIDKIKKTIFSSSSKKAPGSN